MNMSIDGYYLPGYTVETIEDLLQFLDSILTGKSEVWSLLLSFDYEILSQRRVWHNVCMFQLLGGNGFLRQIKRLYYHATSALKVRHCIIRDAEVKMNLAEQILEKYLRQFFFFLTLLPRALSFPCRRVSHHLPSVHVFLFPCRWSWLDSSSWESARPSGWMMRKQTMELVLRSLKGRERRWNTLKPRKRINVTISTAAVPSPGPRMPLLWTFDSFSALPRTHWLSKGLLVRQISLIKAEKSVK